MNQIKLVSRPSIFSMTLMASLLMQGCNSSNNEDNTLDNDPTSNLLPEGITMVDIAGGSFNMGGDSMSGDSPDILVTISDFSISETEITNDQYITFLNSAYQDGWISVEEQNVIDPCGSYNEKVILGTSLSLHPNKILLQLGETGGCTSDGHPEHIDNKSWISYSTENNSFELIDDGKANWPVNWVKWYGADTFANYYNVKLPTEAQWEYAAKAGSLNLEFATDDGTLDSSKANYNGDLPGVYNPDGHSVAVKTYTPNSFGLYDMSGNVWEWCSDYYDADFYSDASTDPENLTEPTTDPKRVRRGGSWNYHASTLKTHARASDYEDRGNNHFGFRIAM